MTENKHKQQVVISMTSFPAAIKFAEQAVRSLLNGSVLPDKLILYVTLSQFAEGEMPETLLALAKQNPVFEIRNYDRDIRSYRKLIPALADFPEAIIVTVPISNLSATFSPKMYFWPIKHSELKRNKLLTQNPGWTYND